MSTIITRAGKGSPLTNNEVDANFNNLNSTKIEVFGSHTAKYVYAAPNAIDGTPSFRALVASDVSGLGTMSTQNANSVAITGGSINGTTVGSTTAAAGSFTTLAASGITVIGTSTGAVNGSLQLRRAISGGTTAYVAAASATVQVDVTGQASGFNTFINTVASSFTLPLLKHFIAQQGTIGATSVVTNQFGYFADSSITGATNNYGFYGDIASGANRYNFYANGTAPNIFVGNTTLGGGVGTQSLQVNNTASAVNYAQVTGAATGAAPTISAQGSDANINLKLTPKGTGVLQFGTYTAGVLTPTGYITITDAGGTSRRLLVG